MRPILWFAAIAAVALVGCATREKSPGGSKSAAAVQRVGPFRVSVANRPVRPIVGENTLILSVQDTAGSPVVGAGVGVLVAMPAMGAMARMESRGTVKETAPGIYSASYGLQMQGDWYADIVIRAAGGAEATASYRVSTARSEIAFGGGTAPSGGGGVGSAPAPGAGHKNHGSSGAELGSGEGGAVTIDESRRQAIGIKTEPVEARDLKASIRAAGRAAYDETRRAEISLKFSGWVREIRVDYTGRAVRAGEPLFTVYSPELFAAQQEYLEALRAGSAGTDLAAAARQRLLLWDIPSSEIDAIARAGTPAETLPIVAPVGGVVVEKNVVAGSAIAAGQTLYKIATVNPVWVIASVYQYELPLVKVGMEARIEAPFLGEPSRRGRISYVNPYLDPDTRTGEVRIEVPNPGGDLKPGMYVDVLLERNLGRRLAVPESAVLYAGDRRVVFVDLGDGRLSPRDVTLGAKAGGYYEITRGLQAGEVVVTSGNFLVAAESKLRSAAQKW